MNTELRTLRYFLAVANHQNLSKAAAACHTTQPNLTRQIHALEEELGQSLFVRGRGMKLTPAGEILRRRAGQISELHDLAESEMRAYGRGEEIAGTIRIGAGESANFRIIAQAIAKLQKERPLIRFDIKSADTRDVLGLLEHGLVDFGLVVEPASIAGFGSLQLPSYDPWGILVRKDSPFAALEKARPQDLLEAKVMHSRHANYAGRIAEWLGSGFKGEVVGSYNLLYNASLLVEEGVGIAFCLKGIVDTGKDSPLAFVPLDPPISSQLDLVYRKQIPLSPAAEEFLRVCQEELWGGNVPSQG